MFLLKLKGLLITFEVAVRLHAIGRSRAPSGVKRYILFAVCSHWCFIHFGEILRYLTMNPKYVFRCVYQRTAFAPDLDFKHLQGNASY